MKTRTKTTTKTTKTFVTERRSVFRSRVQYHDDHGVGIPGQVIQKHEATALGPVADHRLPSGLLRQLFVGLGQPFMGSRRPFIGMACGPRREQRARLGRKGTARIRMIRNEFAAEAGLTLAAYSPALVDRPSLRLATECSTH